MKVPRGGLTRLSEPISASARLYGDAATRLAAADQGSMEQLLAVESRGRYTGDLRPHADAAGLQPDQVEQPRRDLDVLLKDAASAQTILVALFTEDEDARPLS